MTRENLLNTCRKIAEKHKALANGFRVLVLAVLASQGKASWSTLKTSIEKILGQPVNPNLLAFHLRRLVNAGLITREDRGDEVVYEATIPREIMYAISEAVDEAKKIL